MKREAPIAGTTRLVWKSELEEYECEACKAVLHWNFGFRRCPYCRRKVVKADDRRARAESLPHGGVILR